MPTFQVQVPRNFSLLYHTTVVKKTWYLAPLAPHLLSFCKIFKPRIIILSVIQVICVICVAVTTVYSFISCTRNWAVELGTTWLDFHFKSQLMKRIEWNCAVKNALLICDVFHFLSSITEMRCSAVTVIYSFFPLPDITLHFIFSVSGFF